LQLVIISFSTSIMIALEQVPLVAYSICFVIFHFLSFLDWPQWPILIHHILVCYYIIQYFLEKNNIFLRFRKKYLFF
jgi:hypothetical protein